MTKYVLITVRKILKVEIIAEIYETYEAAFNAMKTALYNRLKIDDDEKYMDMLEDGIELSNAILNKNDACIYQDFAQTYHHWKIIEA